MMWPCFHYTLAPIKSRYSPVQYHLKALKVNTLMAGLGHHYKLAACTNCQCLGTASNSPFIEQNRTVDDGAAAALAAIENTQYSRCLYITGRIHASVWLSMGTGNGLGLLLPYTFRQQFRDVESWYDFQLRPVALFWRDAFKCPAVIYLLSHRVAMLLVRKSCMDAVIAILARSLIVSW